MVTPGRFELPTCGLGNRRSIHLSYGASLSIIVSSRGNSRDAANCGILDEALHTADAHKDCGLRTDAGKEEV